MSITEVPPEVEVQIARPSDEQCLRQVVRLEVFEPPTLGSVGTFHSQQLGDSIENIVRIAQGMLNDVHGCSAP